MNIRKSISEDAKRLKNQWEGLTSFEALQIAVKIESIDQDQDRNRIEQRRNEIFTDAFAVSSTCPSALEKIGMELTEYVETIKSQLYDNTL
jgi:hypothetical protein